MAKRTSTPYPRHHIDQFRTKVKEEEGDDENLSKNVNKHRSQSNLVKPIPKQGREVFAILNNEWELGGGEVFPASINSETVKEDSQNGYGSGSPTGLPLPDVSSPLPPVQPTPAPENRGNGKEDRLPNRPVVLFGLSKEDTDLVNRYLVDTPIAAVPPVQVATWIDAIIANTENGQFLDDLAGRIIVPDLDALLAEPQHSEARTAEIELIEPIIPLDFDILFRYDGVVLHIELPNA